MAYRFRDGVYLNLTNRCPTRCRFCVKRPWRFNFRGANLALGRGEPSEDEAWASFLEEAGRGPFREMIFCGFGEPTYRLEAVLELSRKARERFPKARLRLNTVGLGNLINGRAITGELASRLDAVRVSLNTADPVQWRRLHDPLPRFSRQGFGSVLSFIAGCVAHRLDTTITAVEQPGVNLDAVLRLSRGLGARYLGRPPLA